MTASEPSTASDPRSVSQATGELQPFPGHYIPGICFESGHCLWLLKFTSTPTRFDSYTELWLITPDGERILYTDPEEATEEVLHYHEFDRTEGASLIHETPRPGTIEVGMDATDGTAIELRASVGRTFGTRLLNLLIALTPRAILHSRPGTVVSTASLNLLVDANGLKVAGRTETERRYRLDAEQIRLITDASATVNGTDLGALRPPGRPIEFGDAKTTDDALYVSGSLHLERRD